jgi:hypothetical protein
MNEPREKSSTSVRAHALIPVRFASMATGAFIAMHVARISLSSALPMPALVATIAFLVALGLLAFEHPISQRIAPRSRRLQLAMRFGFVAAISIVGFVATERLGMMAFAGATLAILLALALQEARTMSPRVIGPPAFIGAALAFAFHATLSTGRAWGAVALVIVGASFACIAAVMRGGPGRPPARPVDVIWLFGLGAVFALSLKLIS